MVELPFITDRYNYLDKILSDYRHDIITFFGQTKEDKQLIDRLLHALRTYEVSKGLHEEGSKRAANLRTHAHFHTSQASIDLSTLELKRAESSTEFLQLYDAANARRLIQPSKGTLQKLERCEQTNTELQSIINQLRADLKKCQDDFEEYKHRVRPLDDSRTQSGDVGEAPTP